MTDERLLLFQGDSITDVGRRDDPVGLGHGYVRAIAGRLPGASIRNAGVSGDRVDDLARRWDADTLALGPDLVSILIGINDVWHERTGGELVPVERFATTYRTLLERTRETCSPVALVVCEPFALRCGVVDAGWRPALDERRAVVRELAGVSGATFVALQAAFDDAVRGGLAPEELTYDGVHPTPVGHGVIAETWLSSVTTA